MRFSIKTKQVVGVVLLVALAVTALSAIYTALVAGVLLTETQSRGEMLRTFVFERAQRVITSKEDAYAALRADSGLRSLLESSMAYSRHVTYAALVDPRNVVIVHSSPVLEGQVLEPQAQLEPLLSEDPWTQIQAISSEGTFEVSERLLLGGEGENEFGTIRIGISTALIWEDLLKTMRTAVLVGLAALAVSTLVALLLAQWTLRPVHVLQSGFARLGRGEFGVKLDLPAGDEFSELGASFNKLSAELSTVRSQLATDSAAPVESVVDRLEDAVAMVNPDGQVVFANAAIRAALPEAAAGSKLTAWPQLHPYREVVERALATRQSVGPLSRRLTLSGDGEDDETEQWLMAHALLARRPALHGRDAGGPRPRLHRPGAVDAALLAEGGRARPAARRRRARGEEPAQRDDHPSRAPQAEARRRRRARGRRRGRRRPAAACGWPMLRRRRSPSNRRRCSTTSR